MGAFSSRQNAAVEEAEQSSNHAYKYPPRSGTFFGSHFIMGGERFDTPQPEAYLFGENADLNFLGNRPTAFPYPPPQANEPTKTLKSLVNIRKESVRFLRLPEKCNGGEVKLCTITSNDNDGGSGDAGDNRAVERNGNQSYNIEFIFDSDAKCAITIFYSCTEEVSPSGVTLVPRDSLTSETYHYEKGMNQYFSQPTHIFNPQLIPEDDLIYNPAKEQYPVAIHCVVEEGNEECRQSHTTICVIDHHSDCSFALRALKQKIFVDGLCYLLQEIYGIENKAVNKSTLDEDLDDHGSECVICMSETRDTLILPCRHLCLCNSCADSLRYQANNCPICRAPFRALLQIRAVQKGVSSSILHQNTPPEAVCDQHVPAGYIPVSLIEALNGPPQYTVRTRGSTDGIITTGNIAGGDAVNHKATSPHKSNSQRRSKNKKHTSNIIAANIAEVTQSNNETTNIVVAKNNQNTSLSVTEICTGEGNGNINTQKKSPKSDGKLEKLSSRHSQEKLQIVNERNSLKLPKNKRQCGSNLSVNNNSSAPNGIDDDSENEKLSPLLSPTNNKNQAVSSKIAKAMLDGAEESESAMIDDNDSNEEKENDKVYGTLKQHKRPSLTNAEASVIENTTNQITLNADDSDYYTPEDTQNSILSPLCPEKAKTAGDKLGAKSLKGNNVTFKGANNLAMKHLHKKSTSVGNITSPAGSGDSELKGNISSLPDMLDNPIGSSTGGNSESTRSSSDSYSSSSSTKQLLSSNPTVASANIIVDDKTALQNAVNV